MVESKIMPVDINDFISEKECIFDGEKYSVRDNGAVLRHSREGKRARAGDNIWTFGNISPSHPYLQISKNRVHRIVATAFLGKPLDPNYVVDHIDTNCQNNRPENLRWLTRLENALKNPVTRKKIEYLCGSVEAFLEKPSMLNDLRVDPNFSWMRTVTIEEAKNCKERMAIWAISKNKVYTQKKDRFVNHRSYFEKRIYMPINKFEAGFGREPGLDITKSLWCATYMFAPNYFPLCPVDFKNDRLEEYFHCIQEGEIFAFTENDEAHPEFYYSLTVLDFSLQKEKQAIFVLCQKSVGSFLIVGIELYLKNQWFIHFNLGVYPTRDGADKAFKEKQELSVEIFFSEGYKNAY